MKVSDIIRDFFEEKGVESVFLLSGGMMMHLLDSISKSKKIKYICNHHEQASAMAAEGYSRVKNSIGVCYATSGPGATNTITGIAGSWLDSVPTMFITGQCRTSLTTRGINLDTLRMLGTFEVDIVSIVKPITKYSAFVDDAKKIRYHLEKAFYFATNGRPGPVLLDIPLDIQGASVDVDKLEHFYPEETKTPSQDNEIKKLVELFKQSKKPVILAGHGVRVANQVEVFRKFIKNLNVPVLTTQLANDLMAYDDDHYIGKVGLRGDRAGNFCIQSADLIIGLGCSFHITTTGYEVNEFAPKAKKVLIDIDSSLLEKNRTISELQINMGVAEALTALKTLPTKSSSEHEVWLEKLKLWKRSFKIINESHTQYEDKLNTYQIVDTLSDVLVSDEIIITDAGSLYYITGQTLKTKPNQRVIVSGALGAMGYALPTAIGACLAEPNKTVICLTGDGSMQSNVQELQTIATYNLNCKVIVLNNRGYASIRNSQASFLGGHIAAASEDTGVKFPDWKKLAEAYRVNYLQESNPKNLKNFLTKVISTSGPIFAEIVIPENILMIPAVTSKALGNGQFKSNRLHEMSPELSESDLKNAGINLNDFA